MEINKLIKSTKNYRDKDTLAMILSNRIDWYLGDDVGAAITAQKFDVVIADILLWLDSKKQPKKHWADKVILRHLFCFLVVPYNQKHFPQITSIYKE